MPRVKPDVVIDTKGMIRPLPVLRAKKAIDGLEHGQVLGLLSEGAAGKFDIQFLVKKLGVELLEMNEEGGVVEFSIRKI